ncbi:sulfatase-like hydrolase/transferase [Guopingia tenuis]|nr:sulfatase-like hydrolase/transferase [Guopingia tenuis]
MKKPNILFLFADDMRYDTIAALGNQEIKTPNLDKLVEQGTSFLNAHIPGGTIAAVCMPSRAMVNTGRNIFHLQESGKSIPQAHALLGETLRQQGYTTFGTGKWHNCTDSYARSFSCGDEIFFGAMYDHWRVPTYHFDPTGRYANTFPEVCNPGFNNLTTERHADHINWGIHSTDLFTDAACKFLNEYDGEEPFYMYVAYMAPHDPRSMPKKYMELYDLDKISLPPNFMEKHPFDYGMNMVRDENLAAIPRRKEEIKRHIRDYYAMISHTDDRIGDILQALKDSGKYEDTIIIFSADNGLAVGQHGLMGKQSTYEHSIRVPLVMCGPGIPKGETRDGYVYLMDLFPTICDMIGCQIPHTVDGISFYETIADNRKKSRDTLFLIFGDKVRSFKNEKYKLIEYKYADLRRTQLFDLEKDPWEINDLSRQEKMQPVIHKLREELKKCAMEWGDMDTPEGKRFWLEYMRVEEEESGFLQG